MVLLKLAVSEISERSLRKPSLLSLALVFVWSELHHGYFWRNLLQLLQQLLRKMVQKYGHMSEAAGLRCSVKVMF